MKILVLILTITASANSYASPDMNKIRIFVDSYINHVKSDDIESLKALSISKGSCHYAAAKRVTEKVGDNKYTIEVKPFSKNSDDYKFAVALNNGSPVVLGNPSHMIDVKWNFTKENYKAGHKCYSFIGVSTSMTLAISDNNLIKEHSYCKEKTKNTLQPDAKVTKTQLATIKKYILSQDQFSRIKFSQYIMKKYNLKYDSAKKALKEACDTL